MMSDLTNNHEKDGYMNNDEVYFKYLDDLRESGVTNMFGAGPYLQARFNLSKSKAQDVLWRWIDSFEEHKAQKEQSRER